MADILTPKQRSRLMARIRSRGNASTEQTVVRALRRAGISGWRRHPLLAGSPDLVFPEQRVALHIHGCFWHGCPSCIDGHVPKSRLEYWEPKLARTRARDARNRRLLRQAGYRTVQVWEHELCGDRWLQRLTRSLAGTSSR